MKNSTRLLLSLLSMGSLFGSRHKMGEYEVATTFSTYRYQDDHDTEYLRRLLR